MTVQLVWLKRDLRLVDHAALAEAAQRGREVLSDQSQLVSVWRDLGQKHRLQPASDCQSARAAERRSL